MDVILAIDQGSSSTKVLALDQSRRVVASSSAALSTRRPCGGWVEFDVRELWRSVEDAIAQCVAGLPQEARIAAAAISNQRESAIAWNARNGEPIGEGISWQCHRGDEHCDAARHVVGSARYEEITGLHLSTSVSAPKFAWLLARHGADQVCVGTVDAWLASWLTASKGPSRSEPGNGSRTGLVDLRTATWSPELLDAFKIPMSCLPELSTSIDKFGECTRPAALRGVPLLALCGDSHAALFSHIVREPAAVKATYGTGSSVVGMAELDVPGWGTRLDALSRSILWSLASPIYGDEGNVLSAGAFLHWVAALLGLGGIAQLERAAASASNAAEEVMVVPALGGLGAPWHSADARTMLNGAGEATGPGEVALAAFRGVAHLVADIAEPLFAHRSAGARLLADGGASRSDFFMQVQADVLGTRVVRPKEGRRSALGAAYMAGLGAGLWGLDDLDDDHEPLDVFEPKISEDRRASERQRWRVAAARCAAGG